MFCITALGYEPAGVTVHPLPEWSRVGSFFSYGCLVPPKFFPKKKVDFVGDIKSVFQYAYKTCFCVFPLKCNFLELPIT